MAVSKKLTKGLQLGKKASSVVLQKLGSVTRTVGSYRRQPVLKIPAPKVANVGKATYFVQVRDPIGFPTLEFDKRKDAECFKKMLNQSRTTMGMQLKADIIREEKTNEGYILD